MPNSQLQNENQDGSLRDVLNSIKNLERQMEHKFKTQQQGLDERLDRFEGEMENRLTKFEGDIRQFTSREAIHADAVLRNKVEIMWKVVTIGGTVVGTAIVGALLALVMKVS